MVKMSVNPARSSPTFARLAKVGQPGYECCGKFTRFARHPCHADTMVVLGPQKKSKFFNNLAAA
jgi:hypothetical protein